MKKKPVAPITINLLRRHDASVFDALFTWALAVGRLFIIITQFVALGAFLYRFALDRQIIDLNDTIRNKQSVVKFLEPDEKKYRTLQAQLATIAKYEENGRNQASILPGIVAIARGKMELTSFSVDGTGMTIDGTTTSVGVLQSFISELRVYPGVTGVSITELENLSSENRIRANITASFAAPPVDPNAAIPGVNTGTQ